MGRQRVPLHHLVVGMTVLAACACFVLLNSAARSSSVPTQDDDVQRSDINDSEPPPLRGDERSDALRTKGISDGVRLQEPAATSLTAKGGSPPSAPVVECALSTAAANAKIWERLYSRCQWCRPRGDVGGGSLGAALPAFCNSPAPPNPTPRFDFSQPPAAVGTFAPERGDMLNVVYSALGQRFSGPGGQSYVLDAIRQWRLFHPRNVSNIYLLMDDNMTELPQIAASVETHGVVVVPRSRIMTPMWLRYQEVFYMQGYMHPGGSRETGHKHFNQLVSERFFALHGVMAALQLTHVMHFENDNVVYADMRPVVAAADRCGYALASTFANVKHVIPGAMYIRNAEAVAAACKFINAFLSCGERYGRKFTRRFKDYANDMTYLMTFYMRYGSRALGALPAWEHRPGENCMADILWRPRGQLGLGSNTSKSALLRDFGMLGRGESGVLFDLASFGQWYSFSVGADRPPLNVQQGIKGRFIDATPPPKMQWVADEAGRRVPMWKGYRLLTLHIHAKNLQKFLS